MSQHFADLSDDRAEEFCRLINPSKGSNYYSMRVCNAHRETSTAIYDKYWRNKVGKPVEMATYLTAHSGNAESCLFKEPFCSMRGVYFLLTAIDLTDSRVPPSPYGSERIDLPMGDVLNPDDFTLFVIDFYDFKRVGYLTIVSVRKGSAEEDAFRERHYHALNITQRNSWINLRNGDQYRINSTRHLYIHLYCMFDVNMANAVHTSDVPTTVNPGAKAFVIGTSKGGD